MLSVPNVDPSMAPDDALANLFFSAEGLADPAPYYHHLRDVAPVHHSGTGAIFLTRFDDCNEVLRDNRFGKSDQTDALVPSTDPAVTAYREKHLQEAIDTKEATSMLFLNPPDHTRQRRLVSRAFTPRRVEQLRTQIRVLADRAIEDLAEAGEADLLDLVGFPFPVGVIGTMVGVPEADWASFRTLMTAATAALEPGASLEELTEGDRCRKEVRNYFGDLVVERRASPQDDLLSDLIAVTDAGDTLSEGEVVAVATLLFAAGFETTTNLIGNGMGALLRNPDQMQRLWNDQSLMPSAVEEMLRWDSPVQLDVRSAMTDAEVAGEAVPEGTRIVTLLGGANRDPAHFTDPDSFDISRDEGTPMSFASGIHFCLGANLARVEGQEVFGAMINKFSSVELAGDLTNRNRMVLRGYESVPVSVKCR